MSRAKLESANFEYSDPDARELLSAKTPARFAVFSLQEIKKIRVQMGIIVFIHSIFTNTMPLPVAHSMNHFHIPRRMYIHGYKKLFQC